MIMSAIEIEFQAHEGGQLEFLEDNHRFKVACCGRRWGKTLGGSEDAAKGAIEGGRGFRALWCSPTHDQNQEAVAIMLDALEALGACRYNYSTRMMRFHGGGLLFFRSAEIPKNLRGRGWDMVTVDEAAFIPDDVWYDVLSPSLVDRGGRANLLSTPNGAQGFFYDLFMQGKRDESKDVCSWHFPMWANPLIKSAEIERLRRTLPRRAFEQEVEAQFLSGAGTVFSVIPIEDYEFPRHPLGSVSVGVDLAKHRDWTVCIAVDETGLLVDMIRFHQQMWQTQIKRCIDFAAKYVAPVYLDATGIGDVVLDFFTAKYRPVVPIRFTNESKRQLIENLVVAFEQDAVKIPQSAEVLVDELKAYSLKLKGTTLTYNAPPGMHDDCVIALALGTWAHARTPREHEVVIGRFM